MTLTKKQIIKIGTKFLKENKVKYSIAKVKSYDNVCAEVDSRQNIIRIRYEKNTPKNWLASAFLHEFYHVYCFRNKIYPIYHRVKGYYNYQSIKFYEDFIRTALKAERHVDRLAKINFHTIFPNLRFSPSYNSKRDIKWYNDEYLNWFRDKKAFLINKK